MDRQVAASPARAFLIQAVLWNLALFGLIRLSWTDQHLVAALVTFQTSILAWYGATPAASLVVTSSCSGADVMALCVGVTLAYPVAWRRRLLGAAGGVLLILALNEVRLASLYAVAASPARLDLLHLYVWPIVLTAAVVVYALLWIRWSEQRTMAIGHGGARLGIAAGAGLAIYAAMVPWAFTSTALHTVGVWTAATAGTLLGALGAHAGATGDVLFTDRGAFQVTQECLFTPVLPLYLAAAVALPSLTRRTRLAWFALAVPLFFALGVARVLVLALPAYVVLSPTVVAHGFFQLLVGIVTIAASAHLALRHDTGRRATMRTLSAIAVAFGVVVTIGPLWQAGLIELARLAKSIVPETLTTLRPADDLQGALALLPVFQLGLASGLWMAATGLHRPARLATALGVLALSQVLLLIGLGLVSARWHVVPHALVIRGLAIGLPLLLSAFWMGMDGTRVGNRRYARFWHDTGTTFPSLTGAASTAFYAENERRLITEVLPNLEGLDVLKTDLWDEAKNTRILQWVSDQGARVYGMDISAPMVQQAAAAFGARRLQSVVADVRRVPFASESFDAIYSMGTVEHFAETEAAVVELARLLKPGGRLILGVPNRLDPFLRPALVALLSRVGLYAYGFEKSYTRRSLRRMITQAGLRVERETGLLFLPGWLRMLDLWCHTRARPLQVVTRALLQPFVWLDDRVPALRRHGYLLASVGVKDTGTDTSAQTTSGPELSEVGVEYVVDASGCDAAKLRSLDVLRSLFDEILGALAIRAVAAPVWHVFPNNGGITGVVLLSESHLTIHTYPEVGRAAINLYCCRPRAAWHWETGLRASLSARAVTVRVVRRA